MIKSQRKVKQHRKRKPNLIRKEKEKRYYKILWTLENGDDYDIFEYSHKK